VGREELGVTAYELRRAEYTPGGLRPGGVVYRFRAATPTGAAERAAGWMRGHRLDTGLLSEAGSRARVVVYAWSLPSAPRGETLRARAELQSLVAYAPNPRKAQSAVARRLRAGDFRVDTPPPAG
jgi:hypothetical protein